MTEYSFEKKFDIVIVGAGVIGCSIAYFLAQATKGKLKIAVVDRNTIGQEASGGAAGMLGAQIESDGPGPFLDLALASRNMFKTLAKDLKDQTGIDVEYIRNGILSIAFNDSEAKKLHERMLWQKKHNLNCEWVTPEEVNREFPFINSQSLGGIWIREDGLISSSKLVQALSEAAIKLGVEFFENESFDPAEVQEPKIDYLNTNISKFIADKYIFSTGPWTGQLLGKWISTKPIKGQILLYNIPSPWMEKKEWQVPIHCGTTPEPHNISCYLVPKKPSQLWVGATMESKGFDQSENKTATVELSKYAQKILPDIKNFTLKSVWMGLRPDSKDHLPIMGLIPGFQNAYVATGHFRNGILLSAVTGKIMSDIIVKGSSSFPIEPFSPDRFLSK